MWLQAKIRDHGLGLRPSVYAGSVCDNHVVYVAIVALYLCLLNDQSRQTNQ